MSTLLENATTLIATGSAIRSNSLLIRPQLPSNLILKSERVNKPQKVLDYNYALKVVACFIECGGNILLLKRSPGKSYGDHWCLPSGKVEKEESLLDAVVRETYEETGLVLSLARISIKPRQWFLKGQREDKTPINLHLFTYSFDQEPIVSINMREHRASAWVDLQQLRSGRSKYKLMPDSDKWLLK